MKIKTRFAPSPTGHFHIGNARTALYSWLLARSLGGKFILRIENTDSERDKNYAVKDILEGMKWLKLYWDEGPYFQTDRLDYYNSIIENMISKGLAYKCFCSKERIDKIRRDQIIQGQTPKYDGLCRNKYTSNKINQPHVVRFVSPSTGYVLFKDMIRGSIKFNNKELDDLIIRRSNFLPTYNFCSVIDDLDMNITHIIRGEEHISNTPKQINILKSLNAPIPYYAHVPMVLDNNGKKVSKRSNDNIKILDYKNNGFLPEALLNYLVRLGWSYGDKEIFSIEEMQKLFNLGKFNKSASILDMKKLLWLNKYYINQLPIKNLSKQLIWHLKQQNININNDGPNPDILIKILGKRYKTLKDIAINSRHFYEEIDSLDVNLITKYVNSSCVLNALLTIRNKLSNLTYWTQSSISELIKKVIDELKVNINKICMALRVILINSTNSPSINDIIYAIGKSRSISRIDKVLNIINNNKL